MLLAGLAGCSGIDVVDILEKKKVDFSHFSIDVETEQTEEHPKVFKDITITYRMKTNADNKIKVEKAIELSLDKYCGVSAMLKKNSAVNYKLVIEMRLNTLAIVLFDCVYHTQIVYLIISKNALIPNS